MNTNKFFVGFLISACVLVSCSKEVEFSDFDYQTVYFSSQYPVRTIVLGEDMVVDNTLDNQHKCSIKATLGGMRENNKDILIDYVVDESLCTNSYFSSTGPKVLPLPSNYYTLGSSQIKIPTGSIIGGVDVQLAQSFFDDPLAITNNYVLPLRLTKVNGADSILRGIAVEGVNNPNRLVDANWAVKPKDFVLYAIKFVNIWHGNYLRRGVDEISGSVNKTVSRHKQYVESDEINKLTTRAYKVVAFPTYYTNSAGANVNLTLLLTFDEKGDCVIASETNGITATGTGKFVSKGEKNSWGGKDRDALYLNYTVNIAAQNITAKTLDTLVMRDRAVAPEYYTPVVK
ncbi:MAG TPA: DUF5627 domain-containing protein [Phnomibacter sp.]|nr:DUF5627 domain-containing protein [Phnomibacter sp.]